MTENMKYILNEFPSHRYGFMTYLDEDEINDDFINEVIDYFGNIGYDVSVLRGTRISSNIYISLNENHFVHLNLRD